MKPSFALSLSFDGIRLLQRAAGGWRIVGETALDAADLATELEALRQRALALGGGSLQTKILLPNEQIKYLSIDTPGQDQSERRAAAIEALDGATPYPVAELAFDISADGDTTHVAAVARETLAEAEAFAVEHRFNPVSFAAIPGELPYLGEPFFGQTKAAKILLVPGEKVEPDGIAVVVIGPAEKPQRPAAAEAAPKPVSRPAPPQPETPVSAPEAQAPQNSTEPAAVMALRADPSAPPAKSQEPASDAPAAVGFASRRAPVERNAAAPSLGGATRDMPAAGTDAASVDTPEPALLGKAGVASGEIAVEPESIPFVAAPPAPEAAPPAPRGGFLSRRRQKSPPEEPPLTSAKVIPAAPAPEAEDVSSEQERMTIFGARKPDSVGGKPRFLGLILTAALLVFLAGVAAWASVFLDDRLNLSRLFAPRAPEPQFSDPAPEALPETQVSDPAPAVMQETQLSAPAPDASPETQISAPAPEALPEATISTPEAVVAEIPEPPAVQEVMTASLDPGLSEEDTAVLDALREPRQPAEPEAPSETELEARYAATGIWPVAPVVPPAPPTQISIEDLYLTSIDPVSSAADAIALPPATGFGTDEVLAAIASPPVAGTRFSLDAQGLVIPTAQGALSPDGYTVYLGSPPAIPPPTPTRFQTEPQDTAIRSAIAAFRPQPRPADLVENAERAQLDGLTRSELAGYRPALRPPSLQQQAEAAAAPPEPDSSATPEATNGAVELALAAPSPFEGATEFAARASLRPDTRPRNFSQIVQRAQRAQPAEEVRVASAASVAPRAVQPKIPSKASVAKQATVRNAINLRKINLIGVYGKPSSRRALVRLDNGRYRKVVVGDRLDGGRVSAIGDNELRYTKRGRDLVLKMPR